MNKLSDSTITFLLFEATNASACMLKGTQKHRAKQWFEKWWVIGIKMWKELQFNISKEEFGEVAQEFHDSTAEFIYNSAVILANIEIDKRDEVLKKLKTYLNE